MRSDAFITRNNLLVFRHTTVRVAIKSPFCGDHQDDARTVLVVLQVLIRLAEVISVTEISIELRGQKDEIGRSVSSL